MSDRLFDVDRSLAAHVLVPMQRHVPFLVLTFALAAALTGCATVTSRPGTAIPADLAELAHWEARGRLGVSGAQRGGSGSFTWAQHNDRADVHIRGPVGIGGVRLQMSGSTSRPELKLETSDGQVFRAKTAWDELEGRLGASLPAGKLRYWMLGLPAPGAYEWIHPPDGETATLEQDGWRIEYRYAEDAEARLPTRIRAASGAARVRIIVDRWQLGR